MKDEVGSEIHVDSVRIVAGLNPFRQRLLLGLPVPCIFDVSDIKRICVCGTQYLVENGCLGFLQ